MTDEKTPSDTVLDELPVRAIKFLGAVSTNRAIRAVLAKRGYAQSDHDQGWKFLLKATGYRSATPVALESPASSAAIAELDAWDEPNFRVARAALAADFAPQLDFVFSNLEPQTGAGSVVSVTTFLDRLDALEHGADRKATRKADHAALAKLSERGIPKEARTRLRGLLTTALGPSAEGGAPEPEPAIDRAAQRDDKLALHGWYSEWSEVARADIKRRDHLIHLGMAKRKVGKKKGEGDGKEGGET